MIVIIEDGNECVFRVELDRFLTRHSNRNTEYNLSNFTCNYKIAAGFRNENFPF